MNSINCPICGNSLLVKIAHGRRSGKPFIMLKCQTDARHLRAFITDQNYVRGVINNVKMEDADDGTNVNE